MLVCCYVRPARVIAFLVPFTHSVLRHIVYIVYFSPTGILVFGPSVLAHFRSCTVALGSALSGAPSVLPSTVSLRRCDS